MTGTARRLAVGNQVRWASQASDPIQAAKMTIADGPPIQERYFRMAASTVVALLLVVDDDAEEVGCIGPCVPAGKALAEQLGGVLDGEPSGPDADEWRRDPLQLPRGRLLPGRTERATNDLAAARAIRVLQDEVHHQRRREVAAAGDDRGTGVERRLHLTERGEARPGLEVEALHRRGEWSERIVGRAEDGVSLHEGEVVDHHLDHGALSSLLRRYIGIASSGRPIRSSTRPIR